MALSTTPFPRLRAGLLSAERINRLKRLPLLAFGRRRDAPGGARVPEAELDPRVFYVARPARAATPDARLAAVLEQMRMSPYRVVPVVEPDGTRADGSPEGRLVGLVTEAAVVRAFLAADTPEGRARVRETPARATMLPPERWANPGMFASEALPLLEEAAAAGVDALPVVDGGFRLLGLVARSDLVRELARPFRPPTVGGMATPVGVYLTTGGVSGGAGSLALFATGVAMFAAHLLAYAAGQPLAGLLGGLPGGVRASAELIVPLVAQTALFLLLIRLSPLAGYHAAEHQVVHAIERGEPLLVETVRAMPRVHPRCGTNLAAGGLLLGVLGAVLEPALTHFGLPETLAYVAAGVVALAYWRALGGWLQRHLTTRPASDRQIESGIRAARELLEAHGSDPYSPVRPHQRLWRMGFLQILAGFGAGTGLVLLAGRTVPALEPAVRQWVQGLF